MTSPGDTHSISFAAANRWRAQAGLGPIRPPWGLLALASLAGLACGLWLALGWKIGLLT